MHYWTAHRSKIHTLVKTPHHYWYCDQYYLWHLIKRKLE
jgi:hypothetical protein